MVGIPGMGMDVGARSTPGQPVLERRRIQAASDFQQYVTPQLEVDDFVVTPGVDLSAGQAYAKPEMLSERLPM